MKNNIKYWLEEDLQNLFTIISKEERKNLKKIVCIFLIEPREYYLYINLLIPYFNLNINCWIEFLFHKSNTIDKLIRKLNDSWIKYYNIIWIQLENMIWKNISFKNLNNK
jgi:hypothetical protein